MQGGSYLGNVQWQAAAAAPPGLVAIFPAVASTSLYHNTFYQGGALRLAVAYGWGVVRNPLRVMYPQYWHTAEYAPEELRYESIVWSLPLARADLASSGREVRHWRDWLRHPSYDDYWRAISVEEHFDRVAAPVHTHGGWYDLLLGGTLNGFTGMRGSGGSELARRESKMTVGPWGHGPSREYGDVDFGPDAMRNLMERELRWFDHYLKGEDNGIEREPPVEVFFMGINRWAHYADWPVPGTRFTPYYLSSGGSAASSRGDGTLAPEPPGRDGLDHFTYDPDRPVPSVGAHDCCGIPTQAGPVDQRPVEARSDVLVYTSAMVREPLAIAGPVRMKLHAATDGRDTDWAVKLVDVAPSGFAMNLRRGSCGRGSGSGSIAPSCSSPAARTSSTSTCSERRTCSSPAIASGSTSRRATSRSSIGTRTQATTSGARTACGSRAKPSFTARSGRRTSCSRSSLYPDGMLCREFCTEVSQEAKLLRVWRRAQNAP